MFNLFSTQYIMKVISIILIILSFILMTIGGYADIRDKDKIYIFSKVHYWVAGIHMLILALFYELVF